MKPEIMTYLLDIHMAAEAAIDAHKADREQRVLELANDIRNLAWSVKEEVFKTRLLDDKITRKSPPGAVKLMAQARHVSTSLDDILDLL
jgi:hypothetical protein